MTLTKQIKLRLIEHYNNCKAPQCKHKTKHWIRGFLTALQELRTGQYDYPAFEGTIRNRTITLREDELTRDGLIITIR